MSDGGKVVIKTKLDGSGAKQDSKKIKKDIEDSFSSAEESTKKSSSKIGTYVKKIGKVATVAFKATATAVSAVAVYSAKVGSDFESGMSRVAAISGATGDELEALKEKAKELGSTTKFSASEAASAFEYMAMAGWKTEDMLSGVEGIMNLAAASGEDLATTSDIVTDALTAFGLSASDSTHFADVLAAASSNANTNVSMLGDTFKYVAPVAGALGYSAEDTAVAIGLMANSGIKASQAGTSLRSMLSRLTNPTDEVAQAMEELDISLTNSDGTMKSLNDLMVDLRDGFSGLSESEQASVASTLAGQEAMSGLLAIVGASDEDFEKLKDSIYNCDGASAQMAATMQDNLQGSITSLKSAAEGFGIQLYEEFSDPLKDATDSVTEFVRGATDALESGGIDGALEYFVSGIYDTVTKNAPKLFNTGYEMLSNLVSGMVDNIPTALPKILDFVQGIGDNIAAAAPGLIQKGYELLSNLVEGITTGIPVLIERVPVIVSTFANVINDNFPTILAKGAELIWQLVVGLISAIPTLIANIPQIITAIVDVWEAFNWMNLGKNIMKFFKDGIMSMGGSIKESALKINDYVKSAIQNLPGTLKNIGQTAMSGLGNAISSMAGAIKSAAMNIANTVISTLASIPGRVVSIGKNIVQGLWNGISDMTGWVIGKIQGFGDSILSGLKSFFGIHSPSTLMRDEVGRYIAEGIGEGFDEYNPMIQIQKSLDVGIRGLQTSLFAGSGNITTNNQTNNFYQQVQTPDQVARALRLQNLYGLAGAA